MKKSTRFGIAYLSIMLMAVMLIGCSNTLTTAPEINDEDGIPNSPTGLEAKTYQPNANSSSANGSVLLRWIDNSATETGFHIQRRTNFHSSWINLKTVEGDVLYFTDTGLEPLTKYYYRVCAFNEFGESEFSNEVSTQMIDLMGKPRY